VTRNEQKEKKRKINLQKPYMLTLCRRGPFDRLMMSFGL
jgi:hypothetical protein